MDAPPPARPGRKGCGRRKIEIKPIEDQRKRWVSFSKRKKGLLSKADRLSKITGEDIGVIIISEQGRFYSSENAGSVIQRYKEIVKDDDRKNAERDDDADAVIRRYISQESVKDGDRKNDDSVIKPYLSQEIDQNDDAGAVIHRYISEGTAKDYQNVGRDDHDDWESGNGRMVDGQGVRQWFDFMKINDMKIKGKNYWIDLNKSPDLD